jgi:sec-independent protein translocase protein TatB
MFDIGFLEILVLAVIGLLVLGPEKLPVVARKVGGFVGGVKRTMSNFQQQIDTEVRLDELNRKIMADTKDMVYGDSDLKGTPSAQPKESTQNSDSEGHDRSDSENHNNNEPKS